MSSTKPQLSADEEMTAYLEKPTTVLDWIGICFMMCLTYGLTCLLLYIFTTWGANSGPDQDHLYRSCQIFNLVIFLVYIAVCAFFWKLYIGRRVQMKEELIKKKAEIQIRLSRKQDDNKDHLIK